MIAKNPEHFKGFSTVDDAVANGAHATEVTLSFDQIDQITKDLSVLYEQSVLGPCDEPCIKVSWVEHPEYEDLKLFSVCYKVQACPDFWLAFFQPTPKLGERLGVGCSFYRILDVEGEFDLTQTDLEIHSTHEAVRLFKEKLDEQKVYGNE